MAKNETATQISWSATDTTRTGKTSDQPSEQEREALEALREHLRDPEFRAISGFPEGSDDAILSMSAPPDYTACPNPFIEEWVKEYGRPYDPDELYEREPFAVDVSVGKTDALYRAHGYHTKVPHLAIVPSILHYTEPGDIVLDGFCGSGMTGVAAQWCGAATETYRRELEAQWKKDGREAPQWGARRAILNDLSPAATFIAANYTLPFDVNEFVMAARQVLDDVDSELGWMYETKHTDGTTQRIEYTVWSEVLNCPTCSSDVVFTNAALDPESKRVADNIECPKCGAVASKEQMDLAFETFLDPVSGEIERRPRREPVIIGYRVGKQKHEKLPDAEDIDRLSQIAELPVPRSLPKASLPDSQMARVGRMRTTNTTAIHFMFLPRASHALAALWRKADEHPYQRTRQMLLFFVEQAIWGMSILNRYTPTHYSFVNQYLNGVFYVASHVAEVSPWYILEGKLRRLTSAFKTPYSKGNPVQVSTGDCASLPIHDNSLDYVFTDPPFGENIYYADLNYLVESWHGVLTNPKPEAIMDQVRGKALPDYGQLMQRCFAEYFRVLKPGRWMTVVFSNSRNTVWNVIQEGMLAAGFVVADVRTMDKKQGSFKQVTSTAVKQDLVISAYKPTEAFEERFAADAGTEESAWAFVRQHLQNLPIVVETNDVIERIVERQPTVLFDRMVAFHIQRNVTVPLSVGDFLAGVQSRFTERDGMLFLPDQVQEYDAARLRVTQVGQIPLLVTDEKSAIWWLRQQLSPAHGGKPMSYQELHTRFLRDLHQVRHEELPELKDMLDQNFLQDSGGRWYVPDPAKLGDLEKMRQRELLRVYESYKSGRGKLKSFRSEAIRAGFADAYRRGDYAEIVKLADRIPEERLQEDADMLMYYDNASLRFE